MPSRILGRENILPGRKYVDRSGLPEQPPDPASYVHVVPHAHDGIEEKRMRDIIRHPSAGGFRAEGGADWPLDQFTMRRLRDGDITQEEAPSAEQRDAATRDRRARRKAKTAE